MNKFEVHFNPRKPVMAVFYQYFTDKGIGAEIVCEMLSSYVIDQSSLTPEYVFLITMLYLSSPQKI